MFFFDIFWVFISPLFFTKSVMVEVARGGGTGESVPMLLRVPAIGDPFGRDRMLGFGDIALPGHNLSYRLFAERGMGAGTLPLYTSLSLSLSLYIYICMYMYHH